MTPMEIGAGVLWFLLYAILVFVQIRFFPLRSPAALAVGTACFTAAASIPAALLFSAGANYWHSFVVFTFLALIYLMVFGATYKSISLRILLDLFKAPEKKLLADELFSSYVEQESFQARIKVMIEQGLASQSREGIRLTKKGHRIAGAVESIQRLYNIKTSG
jgi:predicted transcriptional regulator